MLVLPISLVTALALAFVLLHVVLRGDRPRLFSVLIGACALQGLLVSLTQHYGIALLAGAQPILATLIPPLAWVTFQTTAVRAFDPERDLLHLIGPALTICCVIFAPAMLDLVVPGLFLFYGMMIVYAQREGPDALPLMRIETGDRPNLIWSGISLGLILSAFSDGLIGIAMLTENVWLKPIFLSLFTSLSLGLVGALVLSRSLIGSQAVGTSPAPIPDPADEQNDADIMTRLNKLFDEEALYLDADLTLQRLSRRLHIPAKKVSTAINRITGNNVSRYVNDFRVRHACERLKAGASVTTAMLESGFNTKSNFNREFLRLKGASPSVWLAEQNGASAGHQQLSDVAE
ncbi:MAG: helix-turn-helix domain-containing protein [Hyphomicrobiales bacterium]|nr:helix-turn-helix domain-containing protein [Hyphomicrobiales bacterium]